LRQHVHLTGGAGLAPCLDLHGFYFGSVSGKSALILLHLKDFHDFVAEMVDHLDCNAAGGRLVKGARCIAVQRFPGFFVDLGLEGGLEGGIGIIGTRK